MKGNEKLLKKLNALLAEELGAINQYIVHAEMCDDWGYDKLHKTIEKRAIDEMKHAEKLIGRILFLEGTPIVTELAPIKIGKDVPLQFKNDAASEYDAVAHYNKAIEVAVEVGDNATKEMLDGILKDEDSHVNDIEATLTQIEQMTLPVFLSTQN
jgi:bacterioferritin